MDTHATPFPVKSNNSKPKTNPKVYQPAKLVMDEPQICRQKRVFGIARNTNIPEKFVTEKPITKPKIGVPQRRLKSTRAATQPASIDTTAKFVTEAIDKKSPEDFNLRFNKKSDPFLQRLAEKTSKSSQEKDSVEPRTPVAAPLLRTKSKVPATPYYTAVHCSKCRFDRLETSSYWVAQIKLAESVSKHFVAVDFFRLALESHAEPIRNLRIELKKYLSRHGYLSEQKEWREVAIRYGLLKVESNAGGVDPSTETSAICRENGTDLGMHPDN